MAFWYQKKEINPKTNLNFTILQDFLDIRFEDQQLQSKQSLTFEINHLCHHFCLFFESSIIVGTI